MEIRSDGYGQAQRFKPTKHDTQFVYFARIVPDGPVKIGFAHNVKNRINALNVTVPYEVRLVFAFEVADAPVVEKKLHEQFEKHKIRGEWFKPTDEIFHHIKKLREERNQPKSAGNIFKFPD